MSGLHSETDPDIARKTALTYRYDLQRSAFSGVGEGTLITLGILLANRYFGAEDNFFLKAGIPAAHSVGLLLIPILLPFLARTGLRATQLIFLITSMVAGMYLVATFAQGIVLFVTMIVLIQIVQTQQISLRLQYYTLNYPTGQRGHRMSSAVVIASLTSAASVYVSGHLLDWKLESWTWLFLFIGGCTLISGIITRKIPSDRLPAHLVQNPLRSLHYVWTDRAFGWVLISWMFMGFGNLLMIPLRVEYTSNPIYGLNFSNQEVVLLAMIIPMVIQVLSTRLWGRLFDRLPFITVRTLINPLFMIGNLIFFMVDSYEWMMVGAVMIGLSMAGANISWNLWVTQFAPPERTTAYMGLHGFTTGLRGITAPFLAFYLVQFMAPPMVCWIGSVLMFISIVILMPTVYRRFGVQL